MIRENISEKMFFFFYLFILFLDQISSIRYTIFFLFLFFLTNDPDIFSFESQSFFISLKVPFNKQVGLYRCSKAILEDKSLSVRRTQNWQNILCCLGSTPYPDMTAREVMRNVQSGYRLERPSHCRSELFRVISRCWHADPDRRPEFQILRRDLAQLLEDNMNGHYVDLESFASECTDWRHLD